MISMYFDWYDAVVTLFRPFESAREYEEERYLRR